MGTIVVVIILACLIAVCLFLLARNLKLSRENKELNLDKQIKHSFYTLVSHELKNPIQSQNTVLKFLRGNLDSVPAETLKAQIGELQRSSDALLQLLNNILSLRHIHTGIIVKDPVRTNLRNFVDDTMEPLLEQSQLKGIRIENNVGPGYFSKIDRGMISTVIRNLLSNAIKFSNKGSVISVDAKDAEDGMIEISVTDHGVGMTERQLENLFIRSNATSTKGTAGETGSGIGLIATKQIVELFGGSLKVSSKPGEGSTFSFTVKKEA